jgi:surfeit locus 1 family protein
MVPKPRAWPVVLATLIGFAVLLGFGVWQLNRLSWKQDLLAQLALNMSAEPVNLARAEAMVASGADSEFVKVTVVGLFSHVAEMRMIAVFDGGPGWNIVTPLLTEDGRAVLVDRGVVPDQGRDNIERPGGPVLVTGYVRNYSGRQGAFAPENDPKSGTWYWWDVPAMVSAAALPQGIAPVNFVLQLEPAVVARAFPRPAPPQANLRNNHLSYAITWFSLAAVLLVISGLYLRGQMKKTIT